MTVILVSRGCEQRSLRWLLNFRLDVVWDAETTRKPALGPARQPRVAGPPESNLKSTTAIFSVPKDRLGCRRTRKSHRREALTRGPYRQSVPGVSRRQLGRTASAQDGRTSPDRTFAPSGPGRLLEDCRAEGSLPMPGRQVRCLVPTHRSPRGLMRSAGLANTVTSSAGLG